MFYKSGTMALAAALQVARERRAVADPQAIIPAYGCPDLVSAAEYAGIRPVMVDLAEQRPWLDLAQVERQINDRTVALVGVHLFGIPERGAQLRRLAEAGDLLYIEDAAQSYPYARQQRDWAGHFTVLSFGRGKPVTILGGGAVLSEDAELFARLPIPDGYPLVEAWSRPLKWRSYNFLRAPARYRWLRAMPFLRLGETHYRPLRGDWSGISPDARAVLAGNLANYQNASLQRQQWLAEMAAQFQSRGVLDVAAACGIMGAALGALSRYPLLLPSPQVRDALLARINETCGGGSPMYPAPLPEILPPMVGGTTEAGFPHATDWSRRLVTLPLHDGVTLDIVQHIGRLLAMVLDSDNSCIDDEYDGVRGRHG
ncbi:MAG: DegT/DnrJ/EryC1/StrS aminotransferase family protein [Gammaproteobacteria bacterium]|nr:DegT/DnrJ/EryC1/StrS aminotransferase family protein [Gammaproteobacteria bacterium]